MQAGIHPNYGLATVRCVCGYQFRTGSTRSDYHLEICSHCHPFFTGKQKLVDSAGRVERFTKRFEKTSGKTVRTKTKTKIAKALIEKSPRKIVSTMARKVQAIPSKKNVPTKTTPSKKEK